MTLNTFKCNYLTPLHFKGLSLFASVNGELWSTIVFAQRNITTTYTNTEACQLAVRLKFLWFLCVWCNVMMSIHSGHLSRFIRSCLVVKKSYTIWSKWYHSIKSRVKTTCSVALIACVLVAEICSSKSSCYTILSATIRRHVSTNAVTRQRVAVEL